MGSQTMTQTGSQPISHSASELTVWEVGARLDRLPASRSVWKLVFLLSLGAFFEYYEIFSTAYVMPGIVESGILTTTTKSFFGLAGAASYIAATFIGMFIGVLIFGRLADRFGRRSIFTFALLGYSVAAVIMSLQTSANGLNFWRLLTGICLGVELVTIYAYMSELVPNRIRGRAFAFSKVLSFIAVPVVAFIAYLLVPIAPFGIDGWRWVFWIGASGAVFTWYLRRALPESPRWLASQGRMEEALAVLHAIEAKVQAETGKPLPPVSARPVAAGAAPTSAKAKRPRFKELWSPEYRWLTAMLILCNGAMGVSLYGFSNWLPTFLLEQGIGISNSLQYGLIISCVAPFGPLLAIAFADRIERKWQLVLAGTLVIVAGTLFVGMTQMWSVILAGSAVTIGATLVALALHTYQSELYPTHNRAMAIGFVVSFGRIGGGLSGFIIAAGLKAGGVAGALSMISGSMLVLMVLVALFGPRTRGRSLEDIRSRL